MKELVQEIIDFYFQKMRAPDISELTNTSGDILQNLGSCFVTLYSKGEIRGSAGNIKEVLPSFAEECITNTIEALTKDSRFSPVSFDEKEDLRFRVERINRSIIEFEEMRKLDPVKYGVIAIKRDYEKLAVILPNISSKLLMGSDFVPVLEKKLGEKNIHDKNYIFYKIESEIETNF